jgi:hypothetical protein
MVGVCFTREKLVVTHVLLICIPFTRGNHATALHLQVAKVNDFTVARLYADNPCLKMRLFAGTSHDGGRDSVHGKTYEPGDEADTSGRHSSMARPPHAVEPKYWLSFLPTIQLLGNALLSP